MMNRMKQDTDSQKNRNFELASMQRMYRIRKLPEADFKKKFDLLILCCRITI